MKLTTDAFEEGHRIPARYAFCDFGDPVTMADNTNPSFSWSDLPDGTKSLVLICHDPDVPSAGDDVNQPDREVPDDLPRVDFYHWVLVDLDPNQSGIAEGAHSNGVTAHGKSGPEFQSARHGINDYTNWFAGDPDMEGDYYGYDGPCPPWNDSIVHHYHFTLYALDVATCPVDGDRFTGGDVLEAIDGHVLAQASVVGTYFLNQRLR